MANIMDYMLWRGDLSLQAAPWCEVDTLICATFCYIELDERAADENTILLKDIVPTLHLEEKTRDIYVNKRRSLALTMAESVRYRDVALHHFVNLVNENTQFSAMIMDFPDGPRVVAFRGTDSTLAGWREDCCMSYETVPAQTLAQAYLHRTILTTEPGRPIVVCGHSKGGNLSTYAASHLPREAQDRLTSVYSFDGPGLDDATIASEGYSYVRSKLFSVIPQGSVVGLLMGFNPKFTVVHSTASGIYQHDNFTWDLLGPHFAVMDSNDRPSQFINDTVHQWLRECTPEQRRVFVKYLFDVLEYGNATTTYDLKANMTQTIANMTEASRKLPPEDKKIFQQMLMLMVSAGTGTAMSSVAEAASGMLKKLETINLAGVKDAITERLPHLPEKKRVIVIQEDNP